MHWTHITLPFSDLAASIAFFTDVCGLSVVRDRRLEGGTTVWLGPRPEPGQNPSFVLVAQQGAVELPLDHFGFQCDTREEIDEIAARAEHSGNLVEGPIDYGGSVGYFVVLREPSGHLVEFTFGQPLQGL
jgi:lactoylglutathione lyase